MNPLVVLDAGHGGSDPGAVNGGRCEKDDVLRLALEVKRALVGQALRVRMARERDEFLSLGARTDLANRAGADLFVSLHRNSHTGTSANGVEIWVYTTDGAAPVGMAAEVLERIAAVGVQSNRGVKKGNYHVLRETAMPAMLVELGFLSNAWDNELFDLHFEKYAGAIARGVCAALGVVWQSDTDDVADSAQSRSRTDLYRVQVGAFAVESNARAFLETVRGMGLEAYLVEPCAEVEGQ